MLRDESLLAEVRAVMPLVSLDDCFTASTSCTLRLAAAAD